MFILLSSLQKLTRREIPIGGSQRSSITQWIYDYIHFYTTRRRLNIERSSDPYEVMNCKWTFQMLGRLQ